MSSIAANSAAARRPWIVSPAWDLFYIVLTPALIVPIVLIAARRWLSPEQVYLAVIAFASLGHHLPGFMRAYGDRELFARYRQRFLLAPPLIFGLALLFTPPSRIASSLGLPWTHLHGLELILLVWGTWHGLMQTYGFMRIYDLRRGENDRTTARLDHALCLLMFAAGVIFSDTRMFGVATAMWQSGLPLFGPELLSVLRWALAIAAAGLAAIYVLHLLNCHRRGGSVNLVKLLLAGTTGWFYWYCGRLSTNVLIGIAMFEIYHAVQYNAFVWIYNRRRFARVGERFGPLGFLFSDRLAMLGAYLAAIAAYSSIRFFTSHTGDRMFSGDLDDARQWLIAAFVTSSLLHFYYDGFIWKVSEANTRDPLIDEVAAVPALDRFVPALVHAAKWAMLAAVAAVLIGAERRYAGGDEQQRDVANAQMLSALARLTPEVPQAQEIAGELRSHEADSAYQQGLEALKRGDAAPAIEPLALAIRLNPNHFLAHLQLGDALMAVDKPASAADAYRKAIALRPKSPDARVGLADALLQSGRADLAEQTLRDGLTVLPDSAELSYTLGLVMRQTGRLAESRDLISRAAELGLGKPRGATPSEPDSP